MSLDKFVIVNNLKAVEKTYIYFQTVTWKGLEEMLFVTLYSVASYSSCFRRIKKVKEVLKSVLWLA